MQLTATQKQNLREQGYLQLPAVVPPAMVQRALRAINHSMGEGINPAEIHTYRAQSYCPELTRSPVITDTFNQTPARTYIETLFGPGNLQEVGYGQIALRFPSPVDTPPNHNPPHIDGTYFPHNGVEKGTFENFTALACVLLSDLPEPDAGNFTVWPGMHLRLAEHFQRHGPETLVDGLPAIDLGEPQQIRGRAGDVIFANYLLPHTVGPNTSGHIRYAIFYRLYHVGLKVDHLRAVTDPWCYWPGLAASPALA